MSRSVRQLKVLNRSDSPYLSSSHLRVLVAGEGSNEFGNRVSGEGESGDGNKPGVVEAIARKIQPDGWQVEDIIAWRSIPKYKAGNHRDAEMRTVLGLIDQAIDRGYDAVLFARDTDGDLDRQASIEKGIEESQRIFPEYHRIAGGAPHPMLESWVLSLAGVHGTEKMGKDKLTVELKKRDIDLPKKPTDRYVALVEEACHDRIPPDAHSLHTWIHRVKSALAPSP